MAEKQRIPNAVQAAGFNGHKSVTGSIQYARETAPTLEANMPSNVMCAALAIDCRNHTVNEELSGTLQAKPDGGTSLNFVNPVAIISLLNLIVRRLTPKECLRLQAFPDNWCSGLAIKNPTDADIDRWSAIFETHRLIVRPFNEKGEPTKPKTRKQIAKWLKKPYSDSAVYKAAGNAVAVCCADFAVERVKTVLERMENYDPHHAKPWRYRDCTPQVPEPRRSRQA